ncbi:MAG: hypothetical protein ACD_34C00117G0002 [uncultured bacterium]|nr:MAG: hypothetical protein ACD_34C00117G0002 [uncultured bacterium]HBY74095.1 hypothetical protein [Candidatus Kerfeldbacteria bacterium]
MPEVKEHLAPHGVEQPVVAPDTKPKPEQIKPTEQAFEEYKQVDEQSPDESPYVIKQASRPQVDEVMTDDVGKSPLQIKVEEVMANGLDASYQSMTPDQQAKFRKKGEEVAKAIEDLTTRLKLTARKVLHLLRSWLKMIPGINKFFLEQETKLKTDEIMKLGRAEMLKRRQP